MAHKRWVTMVMVACLMLAAVGCGAPQQTSPQTSTQNEAGRSVSTNVGTSATSSSSPMTSVTNASDSAHATTAGAHANTTERRLLLTLDEATLARNADDKGAKAFRQAIDDDSRRIYSLSNPVVRVWDNGDATYTVDARFTLTNLTSSVAKSELGYTNFYIQKNVERRLLKDDGGYAEGFVDKLKLAPGEQGSVYTSVTVKQDKVSLDALKTLSLTYNPSWSLVITDRHRDFLVQDISVSQVGQGLEMKGAVVYKKGNDRDIHEHCVVVFFKDKDGHLEFAAHTDMIPDGDQGVVPDGAVLPFSITVPHGPSKAMIETWASPSVIVYAK